VETLRSMLSGLAKLAAKGWTYQINAQGGGSICASNIVHSSSRVFSKALELLHYLTSDGTCRPELVDAGAVEVAVKHCEDQSEQFAHAADSWREALGALANLACAPEGATHQRVISSGGAQALVNNLGTEMYAECIHGLAALSATLDYHPLLISLPLLVRTITLLQDPGASPDALADGACVLANLADNESCHVELQRAGAMQVLVTMFISAENTRLRREVGRAMANMCRVLDNQRALINYPSLWAMFADLASSGDALDEAVAADFYLYISENEGLPEILRFCNIPPDCHIAEPLTILGRALDLTTRQKVAVALANLGTITPFVLLPEPTLKLLVQCLDSSDETIQREALRAIGSVCDGDPEFVSVVLQQCLKEGALQHLGALATLDEVVLKCEAIKIVACMFKDKGCHSLVIEKDGLHKMLALALSNDFVVKAEAVNSLGNLYSNPDCHAQLVKCGGLGVAINMATSEDALVAQKGIRMVDTLCASPPAHVPLVRNATVLKRFKDLAMSCSEGLQTAICGGFVNISSNPDALHIMCEREFAVTLQALAEEDNHVLSAEALSVLMKISEMFSQNGQSAAAIAAVADLSSQGSCRSQIIDDEGYARLSTLVQCQDLVVRREATRALSNLMDNANEAGY